MVLLIVFLIFFRKDCIFIIDSLIVRDFDDVFFCKLFIDGRIEIFILFWVVGRVYICVVGLVVLYFLGSVMCKVEFVLFLNLL